MPALHFISSFGGISYKKLHDITSPFVSCCFTLAFIYISRYDFLHVFRTSLTTIGEKKILSQIILFQWIRPNPSTALTAKIH